MQFSVILIVNSRVLETDLVTEGSPKLPINQACRFVPIEWIKAGYMSPIEWAIHFWKDWKIDNDKTPACVVEAASMMNGVVKKLSQAFLMYNDNVTSHLIKTKPQ